MIRFLVKGRWAEGAEGPGRYRIAGHELCSDVALGLLAPQRVACARPTPGDEPVPSIETGTPAVTASGWLAGADRQVVCRAGAQAYGIDIPSLGGFVVARGGDLIAWLGDESTTGAGLWEEALLGPPLSLALALKGVWCLHASAVLREGEAILFLGASGSGKSTLARYLSGVGAWPRLADDILPCGLIKDSPVAKPHFPQLKLRVDEHYPLSAPSAVPLGAILVLHPQLGAREIAIDPLSAAEGTKHLADQTVSVRLFDRTLHRAHLRFLALLLRAVPMYRLRYPHRYEDLPAVARAVAAVRTGNAGMISGRRTDALPSG